MLVTRTGINDRIERFAKLTGELESGADLYAVGSALQLTPIEQMSFYEGLDGPLYDNLSAKACARVLMRLDSLISEASARYDYDVISVEHVLPQTPKAGSKWLDWFPDPATRAAIVHRVGNLALLSRSKNSQASNWDFDRKKDSYFRRGKVSPFPLTTEVLVVKEWLPKEVEERQKRLMKKFEDHWRLIDRKSIDELLDDLQ